MLVNESVLQGWQQHISMLLDMAYRDGAMGGCRYGRMAVLFFLYLVPMIAYGLLFTDSGYGQTIHTKLKEHSSTGMMMSVMLGAMFVVVTQYLYRHRRRHA